MASLTFYLVEDRPHCSKLIEPMTFEEAKQAAIDYSSDRSNIYDPDRMYINGGWVSREDIPQALAKWSEDTARQFREDKLQYEACLRKTKTGGE
jgi:hypothetical protein